MVECGGVGYLVQVSAHTAQALPSAGREVFLCWEQDEEDIEFWHDLESGFAGRERI